VISAVKRLGFPLVLALAGCAVVTGAPRDVVVRWAPSPEAEVNAPGGGYTVYYSQTKDFALSQARSVAVDYVSGEKTMTSATLPQLTSGTWYIKVVARSTMPNGFGLTAQSPAAETTVVVP
jgi:hypothetical protein